MRRLIAARPTEILRSKVLLINLSTSFGIFLCLMKMDRLEITGMRVEPCVNSRFIQPSRVVFNQVSAVNKDFKIPFENN